MIVRKLKANEYDEFKSGIQEAFQLGYEFYFGKCDDIIIPDQDILESYRANGSHSFVVEDDREIVGGCIVVINEKTMINELHILYVKTKFQSKGLGFYLWNEIEKMFPNTIKWKTCTPCFDKRNYHFYVDKCKFKVTKIIEEHEDGFIGDANQGMYEFEKIINKTCCH